MGELFEESVVEPLEVGAGAFDGEGTGRGVEGEHAVRRKDVLRLLIDAALMVSTSSLLPTAKRSLRRSCARRRRPRNWPAGQLGGLAF